MPFMTNDESIGESCPNCYDNDMETASATESDEGYITQDVKCNHCGATWTNYYQLTCYINLKVPE